MQTYFRDKMIKRYLFILLIFFSISASAQNVLIAYFSHCGENFGVGNIEEGNTAKVAKIIAKETGGTLFEIVPEKPYPLDSYERTCAISIEELSSKARPAILNKVPNFDQYDIIFIGYPVWWNDAPMIIYTFLEEYDFSKKTVIPFSTSASKDVKRVEYKVAQAANAEYVRNGINIIGKLAQFRTYEAEEIIHNWIYTFGTFNMKNE